nr:RNA-directed DNA polymerase, eukaryota [Tanacetum cinerariifolium]
MEGYTFTWSHPSGSKMSKLDRFLDSEGIFLIFPSIMAVCLDCHFSDHRPIILCEVQADFGPIPFRFYHYWISLEGFDAMVEQTWRSFSHNDAKMMIRFKKKIQDLKVRIRAWINDKRSSVSGEKDSIKKELSDIDRLLDGGDVSDSNLLRRSELHRNLYNINQMESKAYIQKSKIKWAIKGDENSKFFHGLINKKRSQFAICGVFVDGIWCNSLFVALIPKITDAKFVNDFQPISLIGSVYKVVTKVLANRLSLVISDLISDTQSAFVAKRQILDGPFIINELLHWCKRKKKQVMFFKVDFAKAYDLVRWDYLLDVLEDFGFGEWSDDNLKGIINILQCFFLASGLKINIQKSQVLGVGVPSSIVMQAASSIGCGVLHKQFWYLGVMMGECMSRHTAWASTVDKLRSRLFKWKVKTLSIGGRLTLLKAVFGALPLYNMSIFKNYWFSLIRLSSKVKALLEGVFCVAWWSIWGFRNRTIYNEVPPRRSVLFDDIMSLSFNWFSSRCNRAITWILG